MPSKCSHAHCCHACPHTGGSSGVARVLIAELARMGATVYCGCRHYKAAGAVMEELASRVGSVKGSIDASYLDLAGGL